MDRITDPGLGKIGIGCDGVFVGSWIAPHPCRGVSDVAGANQITEEYRYDGDGRRVKKVSQDGAGAATTYYAGPHYEVRVAADHATGSATGMRITISTIGVGTHNRR